MRILQALYDGGGGVPPQLAVTSRLVERGHEVRVLSHPTLGDRVEQRGATFAAFTETLPGHDMTRPETDLVRDWEPDDPLEAAARFRDLVLFGPARANAVEMLAALHDFAADAVVLDWMLFGTALAAERANVPAVALVHCPFPLRPTAAAEDGFFAPGTAVMNEVRELLGLGPVRHWDEQLLRTRRVFMLTTPGLDPGRPPELPPNVEYVGPAFDHPTEAWTLPWPTDEARPIALVSLSTTFMDQRGMAERILRALDGLPVNAVFTTGPALSLDGAEIPANVQVTAFAPHHALLQNATLAITHAGYGTVQAALAAGVPLVCLPSGRDQPANAARVAELGAGLALASGATPDEIRAAVLRVLTEPSFTTAARRLSVDLNRSDGASAVVGYLENLT